MRGELQTGPASPLRAAVSRPHSRLWVLVVLSLVSVFPAASALSQQRISGIVIDDSTRQPLPDVALTILDAYERPLAQPIRSDSMGKFSLRVATPGRYRLLASRIGFARTITPSILVGPGLEIPVELSMTRTVQLLAPLTITARPILISRDLEEFEHRRRMGFGTIYTREDIQKRNPLSITDVMRSVVGLRVFGANGYDSLAFDFNSRLDYQCLPVFYLDGFKIGFRAPQITLRGDTVPFETPLMVLDAMVRPEDIYGMEIYRSLAQMPGRFIGPDAGCGVVAVWTRRGGG